MSEDGQNMMKTYSILCSASTKVFLCLTETYSLLLVNYKTTGLRVITGRHQARNRCMFGK